MSLIKLKRIVWSVGGACIGAAVFVALALTSVVVALTGTGANPGDAFNDAALENTSTAASTTWLDGATLDRPLDPRLRDTLALVWRDATALVERRSHGESVDFSRVFEDRLAEALEHSGSNWSPFVVDAHELRADFLSLDGQVATLTAWVSVSRDLDGVQIRSIDVYEATLVLDEATWIVFTFERTSSLTES